MIVLVLTCVLLASANGAKILGVFTTPSYSHQVVFQPIWKELSLRGHQVTVLTPNPLNDPSLTNLTEIDLSYSYKNWNDNGIATLGTKEHSTTDEIRALSLAYESVSHAQLSDPRVRDIINNTNNEQYDLLLVEMIYPLMYAFKDVVNCPMVGITSMGLTATAYEAIGNPINPVLDPEVTLPFSTNLTFRERVISAAFQVIYKLALIFKIRPKMEAMKKEYFENVVRPLPEIANEVSMIIVNSNMAISNVKPTVPALVEISGIHIKEKQPLPDDLQKFMDDANEGVIYFSLGSNVKSETLPEKQRNMFLQAFAELPYKVLWKFENEHLPNKPNNVEIRKWLPQQDLLGHPNLKLFISQGGIQSIDEAIHNEVPMLTIPFFADQRYNSHHIVEYGGAQMLNFHTFTKDEFKQRIMDMIKDQKYKERMITLSKIARDNPTSALDKSMYWIEYVLRHDGAPHLRYRGMDMPTYQFRMWDVNAFGLAVLALIFYIVRRICHHVVVCYDVFLRLLRSPIPYSSARRKSQHID